MLFIRSSQFKSDYIKADNGIRAKVDERLKIFAKDEFSQILNNHKLKFNLDGYRSINITGDWRIIYRKLDISTCFLYRLGTHHQLFGK